MSQMDSLIQENLEVSYKKERVGQREFYSYHFIYNEMNEDERQKFFQELHYLHHNSKVVLRCRCNPDRLIEMIPVHKDDGYHLRSGINMKKDHIEGCNFEGKHNNIYHPNWQEVDGMIRVNFEDYLNVAPHSSNTVREGTHNEGGGRTSPHTFNRLTLYSFFMRLLLDTWNRFIASYATGKNSRYPTLENMYRYIEKRAEKIIFGKNNTIQEVLFGGYGDIAKFVYMIKMSKNICAMAILRFDDVSEYSDTHVRIVGSHIIHKNSFEILCEKDKWTDAQRSLSGLQGPYLIGGWIMDTGYGKPVEYRSLTLLPVSSHGVIVESSYEREFYNHCHDQKRQIIRPFELQYYPSWKGMLPDGLLIDTPIETIIEIFGMSENVEIYHERKRQKIAHFSSLKQRSKPFDFWYWDVTNQKELPDLLRIKSEMAGL